MNRIAILAIMLFALASCEPEGRIFSDHKSLSPNLEWLKKDSRSFQVPIANKGLRYNITVPFRFATGYQYTQARINVVQTSPSGVESTTEHDLIVRKDNGQYIGEPGLDIWDSEHLIASDKKFDEQGTYTFEISHIMPNDPLHYAMEIGLIVDESNIQMK